MASPLGWLLVIFTSVAYIAAIGRQGLQKYFNANFNREGLLRNAYFCYAVGAVDFFFVLIILCIIDGGLHTLGFIIFFMSIGSFVFGYYRFHKKAQRVPVVSPPAEAQLQEIQHDPEVQYQMVGPNFFADNSDNTQSIINNDIETVSVHVNNVEFQRSWHSVAPIQNGLNRVEYRDNDNEEVKDSNMNNDDLNNNNINNVNNHDQRRSTNLIMLD